PKGRLVLHLLDSGGGKREQASPADNAWPPRPGLHATAGGVTADEVTPDEHQDEHQYVTLDQAAATVGHAKRSLENYRRRDKDPLRDPDITKVPKGQAYLWRWATIRPWLERNFGRLLPEKFPDPRR